MEQSNAGKQKSYCSSILRLFHLYSQIIIFSLGHENDVKSLQGEIQTGATSGGEDETETDETPENQNFIGPNISKYYQDTFYYIFYNDNIYFKIILFLYYLFSINELVQYYKYTTFHKTIDTVTGNRLFVIKDY